VKIAVGDVMAAAWSRGIGTYTENRKKKETMSKDKKSSAGGMLWRGALSGAVGTAAMDLLLYRRYRDGGGTDSLWTWEFAKGVKSWSDASAPGQLGQKLERLVVDDPVPDSWARPTTNVVHWATGVGWGAELGLAAAKVARRRWLLGLSLGPAAWLSSYALLPVLKLYKPIWEYDAKTLEADLTAHLLYGAVSATAFTVLSRPAGARRG
jgi:hypothetical protein